MSEQPPENGDGSEDDRSAKLRRVTFDEPGPEIDGAITLSGTYENERRQRFRVSIAAPDNDRGKAALDRLSRQLRIHAEADLADAPYAKGAGPDEQWGSSLAEALDAAAAEARESAPPDKVLPPLARAVDVELLDAPDLPRGSEIEVSVVFDPRLDDGDCDGWSGKGDFGIDVKDGKVRVKRPQAGNPVEVTAGQPYREVGASGWATVVGLRDSTRYEGDKKWTRHW